VFASSFSEGAYSLATGETCTHKRVISTDIDFDTLHNILHYLYTNQIYFHSKPGKQQSTGPTTVDAQRIYEAADRLLLTDLKFKAEDFLNHTCDIQNITPRMFSEFAARHEDLNISYRYFFRTHLSSIIATPKFDEFFDNLEDPDAHKVNAKFRKLVQIALCPMKRLETMASE